MKIFKGFAIVIAVVATLGLLNACANEEPLGPTQMTQLDDSGSLMGSLPSVGFATTIVPPPPPEPEPEPEPEEPSAPNGERNGFYFAKGVLLSSDGACPGCVLKIRDVSVLVPQSAELERRDGSGAIVPISFDEFVSLLSPGIPLDTKSIPGGSQHTAVRVRVERTVRTAGTINKSSADVANDGVFTINAKGAPLQFRLADQSVNLPVFAAGDRLLISGTVPGSFTADNPVLVANAVEKDN